MLVLILQLCNTDGEAFMYYKGVQVTPIQYPYYPTQLGFDDNSFSYDDVKFLQRNKINLIQLNFMLPGLFQKDNTPSQSYLSEMKRVVQLCKDNNISVIIAMYQKHLSELNCGQGFPQWLLGQTLPTDSSHEFPYPLLQQITRNSNGSINQDQCKLITPEQTYYNINGVEHLYFNDSFMDIIQQFWKVVIKEFDYFDNIISYIPFTEPQYGNYINNLNSDILPQFYSKVLQSINTNKSILISGAINDVFDKFGEIISDNCLIYNYIDNTKILDKFKSNFQAVEDNTQSNFIIGQFGRDFSIIKQQLTQISGKTWIYPSLKGYGDLNAISLLQQPEIIQQLSYPYFSAVFGTHVKQTFYFENQSLSLKFVTGEISARSKIEISQYWKLFATNAKFVQGQEDVKVILEDGQVFLENINTGAEVDITIW